MKEDLVSLEVAKLLKEKGFKEWCSYLYGTAVRHNGKDIDEDEEYELEAEGRGDEIEYVEGGNLYHFNCNNDKEDVNVWACPTQSLAMKWLREVHNLCIEPYRTASGYLFTVSKIWTGSELYSAKYCGDDEDSGQFTTWEGCVEYAIKYCLENLVK